MTDHLFESVKNKISVEKKLDLLFNPAIYEPLIINKNRYKMIYPDNHDYHKRRKFIEKLAEAYGVPSLEFVDKSIQPHAIFLYEKSKIVISDEYGESLPFLWMEKQFLHELAHYFQQSIQERFEFNIDYDMRDFNDFVAFERGAEKIAYRLFLNHYPNVLNGYFMGNKRKLFNQFDAYRTKEDKEFLFTHLTKEGNRGMIRKLLKERANAETSSSGIHKESS